MDFAYHYLAGHTFCHESEYTYTARDGSCHDTVCHGPTVDSAHYCTDLKTDATSIIGELQNGPIAIAVDAGTWSWYSSGVVTASTCHQGLNHGVTLTSANLESGYVSIKNSWGQSWGENGYIRVSINDNACGWTNVASIPTVKA